MQDAKQEANTLTPEESWNTIHATFDRARASMYIAGVTNILLFSGSLVAIAFFTHYAIETFATTFATENPWYPGLVWGVMGALAMIGNSFIGHRAGKKLAEGATARNAGIRVFAFWLTVVSACLLIPAAAGMWNEESGDMIPGVTVGVVALGYILFGIMYRPMLIAVGAGIAAAYYLPDYFAGDTALAFQGAATLTVCVLGAMWLRRNSAS